MVHGRRKDAGMGSSKRLAAHYDMRAQHQAILSASRAGPLQSLTERELALREQPVTIYPHPHAAGIEFRADDRVFRCWVWGNAVETRADV